ncbi:MAG: hypothetical protein ABW360_05620 [Phenylobacterium sp.]
MGAYMLVSAIGFLVPARSAEDTVRTWRENRAVAHVTGAVAFFVGAAILTIHPRVGDWAEALVTVTAGWWVLEGAVMLAAPGLLLARLDAGGHLRRMNFVALPVGLALLAAAWVARGG